MAEDKIVVYERGKPEVQKRIDPKLLELVMLDDLTVGLNKVNEHLAKAEFRGELEPRTFTVSEEAQEIDLIRDWATPHLITASFFNDGPNTAYIAVNSPSKWVELKKGESINIDFAKADKRIVFIHHKCDAGETASVRAIGKY